MTRAPSSWRRVALLPALLTILLALAPTSVAAGRTSAGPDLEPTQPTGEAAPRLLGQSASVAPGGAFELVLDPASLPADGSLRVVLHGRVRSRSELAASMDGEALRSTVYDVVTPVSGLPPTADGGRQVVLSLDPAAPGGLNLTAPGVYPVEVTARDAADRPLGTLLTHLILEPRADDESPPLAVAVIARVPDDPALQPDGTVQLDLDEVDRSATWAAEVAASNTPVNVAIAPEAVAALAGSADTDAEGREETGPSQLLTHLRTMADTGTVLRRPFAATSPDALLDADLADELSAHLTAGDAVLSELLGARPQGTTWLAGTDLSAEGAALLASLGVDHVVVQPDQVEPLRSGLLSLSLAQPFVLDLEEAAEGDDGEEVGPVDALALDEDLVDRLDTDVEPALEASRVLAELAMLWFEQPGVSRAVVLPTDPRVRPEVMRALLAGLGSGRVTEAVSLDDAFDLADPLLQPGGGRVDRPLTPDDPAPIADEVHDGLPEARARLASLAGLLGTGGTRLEQPTAHLLLATSTALDEEAQVAHLGAATAAVDEVSGMVTAPERETITLTAREGTVPLTLTNTSGRPITVLVRLRSAKLDFPDGDAVPLVLAEERTRIDIAVRARASGSFPLDVEVTSPDGAIVLARVDYSIRSTAVAGAGVVLSAGAAVFLMVWWARHWHKTRRSAKLMEAKHLSHPAAGPRTERVGSEQ